MAEKAYGAKMTYITPHRIRALRERVARLRAIRRQREPYTVDELTEALRHITLCGDPISRANLDRLCDAMRSELDRMAAARDTSHGEPTSVEGGSSPPVAPVPELHGPSVALRHDEDVVRPDEMRCPVPYCGVIDTPAGLDVGNGLALCQWCGTWVKLAPVYTPCGPDSLCMACQGCLALEP